MVKGGKVEVVFNRFVSRKTSARTKKNNEALGFLDDLFVTIKEQQKVVRLAVVHITKIPTFAVRRDAVRVELNHCGIVKKVMSTSRQTCHTSFRIRG